MIIDIVNSVFDLVFRIVDFIFHANYLEAVPSLEFAASVIIIFSICGIAYSVYQSSKIFKAAHAFEEPKRAPPEKNKNQEDWNKILAQGKSENENDRKQAVIAADSLLEKIFEMAGFSGADFGEKLKNIDPADLDSLNGLWEAHKIRNNIAHEAGYSLSKEDAERALSLFEKTLKELEYI